MSKGYGKCQRLILEKLTELKAYYLTDILPVNYTLKQYQALHRAAYSLAKAGLVLLDRHSTGEMLHRSRQGYGNCGLKLLIHEVGTKIEHPIHFGEPFKCIKGNSVSPIIHLGIAPTMEEVERRLAKQRIAEN